MKTITGNCSSSDSINVKQLILLIYCLYTRKKNIIFVPLKRLLIPHLCFDSECFHYVSCGAFLGESREETYFLFGRFIAGINTYLDAKFKNNLSGESV